MVAVTDSPGTEAVADKGAHCALGNHTQVGNWTVCGAPPLGEDSMAGVGGTSLDRACAASTRGSGSAVAPPGIQVRMRVGISAGPLQVRTTQWPAPGGCAAL